MFFPAQQITSLLRYEIWMVGMTLLSIGLAAFFFFVYGRRKAPQAIKVLRDSEPVSAGGRSVH